MKFLEILLCYFCLGFIVVVLVNTLNTSEQLTLLSDPFLQLPTPNSIRVVWFTEFAGDKHQVFYDNNLAKTSLATTTKLSKVAEDKNSQTSIQYTKNTPRDIWRHEAI
ncbi:MAG: metallophosphoesterase, partial [Cyanobacteria bacterium J083]